MENSHKIKKLTKKQAMQNVVDVHKQSIKDAKISGIMIGYEVANQMIVDYAKDKTLEEVVSFCKKNIKNKSLMSQIISGKEEE